ncbi:alpha/beta hydrolase [Streptomyces lydicamycinicus]|uniref:alpha/beta hydrolase n=1 Tax=Streptomyces lydicamycinicus TaxID=1546107 RepID=UPI002035D371|nr:alpha/beta hydrolase [Streptomyces lydicamycinicus]USA02384.1 alpha/beta hydrolase [Streptomyces lydicamycinicus]
MTTYAHRTLLLALSVATVATTVTAAAPVARADAPGTNGPALTWRPCAEPGGLSGQECARLPVPLDYRDPDGPQIGLAVTRVRSERPAARRGTLLVIPGGPGGSGVRMLATKGPALRKAMAGAYDLVSFDPRGVGGSTRAGCELDPADRHLVTLRSWPGPDGEIGGNAARSRRIAEACRRHGGAVLRSFTTVNEARDIDRLRRALGEEKLSAWAHSYGTYVGAVYAQKYPQRTDRWVLDSSGDPDPARVGRGWLANTATGADDRFPDFAAWAADPARESEGLRLARRPADVRPLFLALAAKLDREPKGSSTPGVPLTGNRLRQALQDALESDGLFAEVARLIQQAQDPAAEPVLPDTLAGPLPDQDAAATMATVCNDVRWPASVPAHRRAVAADRARHPLTAGMPVNITPCGFWQAPAEPPTRITADGPSNILMVQNRRDPNTPYFGALKMRRSLGERARLLTLEHGGHGAYLANGPVCGDRTVTAFLTTGRRPQKDTRCAD